MSRTSPTRRDDVDPRDASRPARSRPGSDRAADVQADARGQFAPTEAGGDNSGVSSAAPQAVTGEEDATFDTDPGSKLLGTLDSGDLRRRRK